MHIINLWDRTDAAAANPWEMPEAEEGAEVTALLVIVEVVKNCQRERLFGNLATLKVGD